MQDRHTNKKRYFDEQASTTRDYVIPYIAKIFPITQEISVLEIGCGEGGNLVPFVEIGCKVLGIDILEGKIKNGEMFMAELFPQKKVSLLAADIYDISSMDVGQFNLIIMRDVIEHIPNQERFLQHLKSFLNPGGKVFFGFPPWYMPFGGHQQVCRSNILSKTPYFHLLPKSFYREVLRFFGEKEERIEDLIAIKDTGISTHRFRKIVKNTGYQFVKETLYLFNPNYDVKFGIRPKEQFSFIAGIPFVRDFLSTCMYCIIEIER